VSSEELAGMFGYVFDTPLDIGEQAGGLVNITGFNPGRAAPRRDYVRWD